MTLHCRVCGHDGLAPFLHLDRVPANISFLPPTREAAAPEPVALDVLRCPSCGMVQLAETLSDTFYEDYVMTVSHSPKMRRFQAQQAAALVGRYELAGRRVIDVGCGDGQYLSVLEGLGAVVAGLEPSAPFKLLAEARGHRVFAGYAAGLQPLPEGPYDAFVTRQVLEHVPDPIDFLSSIRASLSDDGVGLVEVPSIEQALARGRFFDFFPDHLNYFSAGTLARALERSGFLVDDVTRGMDGEYLQAFVRVDAGRDAANLRTTLSAVVNDLASLEQRCIARGLRLAVWGAGAKGLSVLAATRAQGVALLVDSDPHKHGRFTPGSGLLIEPVERLTQDPVDVVVVTAMAYVDEIVGELRGPLGFTGAIYRLGQGLEELDPAHEAAA
ncbi:MAG TPA: class I SAM-dependent methyltransferase [Gaiellales bacterium]